MNEHLLTSTDLAGTKKGKKEYSLHCLAKQHEVRLTDIMFSVDGASVSHL